jgi:thioredoxin-related protein
MNMHHYSRFFFILLVLGALVKCTPANAQEIKWLTWEEAQARNAKEPRKFIVDVYTQWCGWCKKMDKATWEVPEISKYINANYYPVKFDAETKEDISFNDRVFKYVRSGSSGYNELAVEITFGKLSYPTIVFLDENMNVIQPIPGYKDPGSLDKIMKYFAEDYYKTIPWKKYEEMYIAKGGVLGDDMPKQPDKN